MRALVTGASGMIGSALCDALLARGDEVVGLSRDPQRARRTNPAASWHAWEPAAERPPHEALEGTDAVFNVIGENINQRLTPDAKLRIHDSRVRATRALADAIARVVQGQVRELEFGYDPRRPKEHYFSTIQDKTAALFEASSRLGASVGGCPPPVSELLGLFGFAFGLAFQVADDLLDLAASQDDALQLAVPYQLFNQARMPLDSNQSAQAEYEQVLVIDCVQGACFQVCPNWYELHWPLSGDGLQQRLIFAVITNGYRAHLQEIFDAFGVKFNSLNAI